MVTKTSVSDVSFLRILIYAKGLNIMINVGVALYILVAISDCVLKYFSSRFDTNVQSTVSSGTTVCAESENRSFSLNCYIWWTHFNTYSYL